MSKKYFFILPLLFLSLFVSAQSIRLNGKVINSKNEAVPGATISVEGMAKSLAADVEGRFSLTLEAGKKYVITVSSAGYNSKAIEDVEVKTGDDNNITVVLEDKTLTEVVVRTTVRRESTAALLNFQRNNSSVSSGLAADFIRRTPDKNTGEVLKRVSGASVQDNKFVIVRGLSDRYNAAMINSAQFPSSEPDKRAFSFDIIPSNLVDNIIINKTATPEITGEFAGGVVQVTTKDVPSKDFLNVGVSFGYNTNSTFKDFISNERGSTDWLGYDDGGRSLPNGFPTTTKGYGAKGISSKYELSRLFRSDVYKEHTSNILPIMSGNITYGMGRKLKNGASLGIVAGITYRNAKSLYTVQRQEAENEYTAYIKQFSDAQNRYSTNIGALLNVTYSWNKTKISFKNLVNQLYDDNYYIRTGLNIETSSDMLFRSSFLNQRTLYTSQLEGEQQLTKSGIKLKLNGNFSYNWKTQPDLRTVSYVRQTGTANPFSLLDDETNRFYSNLKDYSYGGGGQLIVPFNLLGEKQTLKAGGSTLIRVRDFKARNFRYSIESPNSKPGLEQLPFDQIFNKENIGEDGFLLKETTSDIDKYFGVSIVNAGYLMFDNKLGDDWRLIWGARVENFQQVLTTIGLDQKRVVLDNEDWDVLPSLNLVYNVDARNSIRLAASQTVARPEFREIAPFSFFDFEQNYAVAGETTLKRSKITNLDLRYEFYPKAGENISFGAFYKDFKDPIELRARAKRPSRYSFANAEKARSFGLELEVRKNLDFIAPKLENFSIFSNLTWITSKVTLATTQNTGAVVTNDRPLQGQSPYLINVGLQYGNKNADFAASVLYNRIGQRLTLVGDPEQKIYDIYERPRDQLDFQISKKVLKKRGEIKLNIADILNQPISLYENFDDKKAYKSGTDRTFNSYTPGTTFTIGFTYDFIR